MNETQDLFTVEQAKLGELAEAQRDIRPAARTVPGNVCTLQPGRFRLG
jgi:hypothetical protein